MTSSGQKPFKRLNQYALSPVRIDCPACGTTDGELLYSVTAEQSAQHFVLKEVDADRHSRLQTHIATLWKGDSCNVVRCKGCGLAFSDPFVAGDSTFYDLAYDRSGYPQTKWEYRRTLSALQEVARQASCDRLTLLEIGAGNGAFVKQIDSSLINLTVSQQSSFVLSATAWALSQARDQLNA